MALKRTSKPQPTTGELLIALVVPWFVITSIMWWQVAVISLAALLLVSYSIAWLTAARRRWNERLRRGECLHCGYDLRASVGRCPECGNDPVVVKLNAPPVGL